MGIDFRPPWCRPNTYLSVSELPPPYTSPRYLKERGCVIKEDGAEISRYKDLCGQNTSAIRKYGKVLDDDDDDDVDDVKNKESVAYTRLVRWITRRRCIGCYRILCNKFSPRIANMRCNKTSTICADCNKPYCKRCFSQHMEDMLRNS